MDRSTETEMALNAMRRAAKQAHKRAASFDLDIPIWEDGKVIFVEAKSLLKDDTTPDYE